MLNYTEIPSADKEEIAQFLQKEKIDSELLNSLIDENVEYGPESVLSNTKYNPLLTPFELKWVFGFDVNVPVLNLTNDTRHEIFYSATNVGILYDYCEKKMVHLKGHQYKIVSVSVDRTGRWLATADNGSDKVIMIWDTTTTAVVWTIFNHPPKGNDLLMISLSPNARLLITISNENENTINFWLWTYGNEEPDDTYTDDRNLGAPKSVEFHPNQDEHFMIVFEKAVLLFCWDYETQKLSKIVNPKSPFSSSFGHYTDGTYVEQCHECFVSTSKGCILVFGNTIFTRNFTEELDNDKLYIKCIKSHKGAINCLVSVDELIVTGDSSGNIMFFDKRVKLLYWFPKGSKSIRSISFKLNPRKVKFVSVETSEFEDDDDVVFDVIDDCIEDRSGEYETLILQKTPKDASLENYPFVSRNFFTKTSDGTLYMVNFLKHEFIQLFPTTDSHVAAIDVHNEKPFLVIAYTRGRLVLFNYETHEELITCCLPETEPDAHTSTIKYSCQSLHLACGRSNGELWMIHPVVLTEVYVDPFKFGPDKIMKIAFSKNDLQMAYYDSNMTVYAFYYDTENEDWLFKGKVRSHYKEICNILFLDEDPRGLYTIGKDRHIIRYTNILPNDDELDIITRDRIEQKDTPYYFISYPKKKFSKCGYFLTSDDKHKYKTISTKTAMCTAVYLGPAYGCFKDSPVRKMEFIPKTDEKYLIFLTKKHIGLQLMPIDGNPYKFIGCLGHPEEVMDFQISNNGKYVFTVGKNDRTVFMWKIKLTSVETLFVLGGLELQPYYCLIEGGRNGFLYEEMRDLFYYMQILQQGEQECTPRFVSNHINIGELPDLMRACGYYPSEYEIENLLTDVRYKQFDDDGILKDKVTFCEFVKLFLNHKPAYGYSIEDLEEAFETIMTFTDEYGASDMPRDDFIEAITTTGEQVSTEQIFRCLATLLHAEMTPQEEFGERDFTFMPDDIDFNCFAEDILGLDLESLERAENGGDDDEDLPSYYFYHH